LHHYPIRVWGVVFTFPKKRKEVAILSKYQESE
jgi:hypothetical protein